MSLSQIERDEFFRELLRVLVGSLQETVGLENVEQFVAIAGSSIGEDVNRAYCNELSVKKIPREQLASVLVDFKARIKGDFYVISEDEDKIVLGNRRCPYGDKIVGREGLCTMTTNMFGVIAAENTGYSKIAVEKAIARGHPECRVVIYLNPDNDEQGIEFFGTT